MLGCQLPHLLAAWLLGVSSPLGRHIPKCGVRGWPLGWEAVVRLVNPLTGLQTHVAYLVARLLNHKQNLNLRSRMKS